MKNLTLEWFKAALIRALKTVAQTAVGMITVGAAIRDVDWLYVCSVSVVAGIVSLLTSLGGIPEANPVGSYVVKDANGDGEIEFDWGTPLKDGKNICLKVKDEVNK